MSDSKILLDSNILILASKGKVDMPAILARYEDVLISIVSQVEVLGFAFPTFAEEAAAQAVVAATDVLPFTQVEAQFATTYRKARRKIPFADAAILATARAAGADLLTENLADFQNLDPQVRVLRLADL